MNLRTTLSLVLAFVMAVSAQAQFGNGGNGDLEASPMALNSNFTLKITGGANQAWYLFLSDGPGPVFVPPIGNISLDVFSPNFALFGQGVLSAQGVDSVSAAIPNDPAFLSLVAYAQALVVDPLNAPSNVALTRGIRIDFENPDSFTALPNLFAPRALATGDLLHDGRVLVCGGGAGTLTAPQGASSTEIYQPFSRTWSNGPPMLTQRAFHTSVVLNDGRVLIMGGADSTGNVTASCELYNPITNTWAPAASMNLPRAANTATLLQNGKVLVAGGTTTFTIPAGTTSIGPILAASSNTGEVYDPSLDTWSTVPTTMASKRFLAAATLMNDGRVLIIAGINGFQTVLANDVPTYTTSCSYYNPTTNAFTAAPAFPTVGGFLGSAPAAHRATTMPNGEVFECGGVIGGLAQTYIPTATGAAYKFNGTSWTAAGTLPVGVAIQGQTLLKNGKVFVCGGGTGTLLAFTSTDQCATRLQGNTSLALTSVLPAARGGQVQVRLQDGSVLVVGGSDAAGAAVDTTLLYTPIP